MKNFGKCIIFSAPSGSGKTTLVRELLKKSELNLSFSISATTRNKRQGEINGKDYFFKSKLDFKELIKNNQFLEFEEVYEDVFYGSLKKEVNKLLETSNVIFDIDVIGGIKLKKFFQHDALAVFVKPPSIEELRKRLVSRASDSLESINSRVEKAEKEIESESSFDVTIINNDLITAKKESYNIVKNFLINE
jgi:guanylate kinase|tara:strand:- start:418 stop:993 length:576 start_codon:yes stop_codon:yes gene_type:complete